MLMIPLRGRLVTTFLAIDSSPAESADDRWTWFILMTSLVTVLTHGKLQTC